MTEFTQSASEWGLHTAAAGVAVFGLGWACVRRVSDPARRQQLAGWVVRGGLLAAVLCLLPAWLVLPVSPWGAPEPTHEVAPPPESRAPQPEDSPPAGVREPLPAGWPEPDWLVAVVPPAPSEDTPASGSERHADQRNPASDAGRGDAPAEGNPALGTPYSVLGTPHSQPLALPRRVEHEPASRPEPAADSPWPGIAQLVLLAYGVAVAVAVFPLLLGTVALARLRRNGKAAPARVRAIFDEVSDGLRVRPRLLVADRLASPVCFGLVRPVVMLPKELANTASATELRWVLAHELSHLRRGDPWTGWWVGLAKAVYFAVPWFWRVKRDLMLTQEYLADAAAAAAGGRVEDYAAFLVRLSGGPGGRRHPVGAAAVRAGKSDLFRRVTMLLATNGRATPRVSRWWSVGVAVCVLGAVVVLSGVGFARPADDEPKPRTRSAEAKPEAAQPRPADQPREARVPASPELAALRKAVEDAEKKGADVTEIRKQLDALEKAMGGKRVIVGDQNALIPAPGALRIVAPPVPDVLVPVPGAWRVAGQPEPRQPAPLRVAQPDPKLQAEIEELRAKAADLRAKAEALKAQGKKQDAEDMLKRAEDALKKAEELQAQARQSQPLFEKRWGERPTVAGAWSVPGGAFEPRLGVMIERVPAVLADQLDLPKGQGLVLSGVLKEQAADKAGLKPNDILLEVNGKPVPGNPADFLKALGEVKAGDKVNVLVIRKGKKETIKGVEVPEAKRGAFVPGPGGELDLDIAPGFTPPPLPARPGRPLEVQPFPPGAVPPTPPVPALPGRPVRPGALTPPAVPAPPAPVVPPGAGERRTIEVRVENGEFTIKADENGVKFLMSGPVGAGGKPEPTKIEITDGDKKIEATSVEKVPAGYRDRVQKILDSVKVGK